MNGYDRRTAVLIEEMRIGPIWTPRAWADAAPAEEAQAESMSARTPLSAPSSAPSSVPLAASRPALAMPPSVATESGRGEAPVQAPFAGAERSGSPQLRAAGQLSGEPAVAQPPAARPAVPRSPASSTESAWDDDAVPPLPQRRPAAPQATPAPSRPAPEDAAAAEAAIAAMDWPELRAAIQSCRRCDACRSSEARVLGQGPQRSAWMVVAGAPMPEDVAEGEPLAGDAGRLLENMLSAIDVNAADVYVTQALKCRPASPDGAARAPRPEQIAACRPYLQRELALTGAQTVLALGQVATNTLLERPLQEPLSSARGQPHRAGQTTVVATLHPRELLMRSHDKAHAWADLCLAAQRHGRAG